MRGPHRRRDPLSDGWVLVSPQRLARPWTGAVDATSVAAAVAHDATCALCPGVARAGGRVNPQYTGAFVFDNDFAALVPDGADAAHAQSRASTLFRAEAEQGLCRVVCFSPRHDASLATMSTAEVRGVVDVWCRELDELRARPAIGHALVFENRGAAMGASNPHPHGQIWAQSNVPHDVAVETRTQRDHARAHGSCLLCDVVAAELDAKERVVLDNDHFVAFVPFWARWPFETLVVPRAHRGHLTDLVESERDGLTHLLGELFRTYDRLFSTPMPLTWGFHGAPFSADNDDAAAWHLHAHIMPPLLRSASVRKWMVGYELLGETQRDLTPEAAAERLRDARGGTE